MAGVVVRATEARQIAELGHNPHNVIAANWALGYLNCTRGTADEAIHALDVAHRLSLEANVTLWLRPSAALLGYAHILRGEAAVAIPLLERAVKMDDENQIGLASWETFLGAAYMAAGRLDDAWELTNHALSHARQRGEQGFEAHALRLIGDIASRDVRLGDAVAYYSQALALAEARGMLPLAARCHAALGELYRSASNMEETAKHLGVASALFEQLKLGSQ